MHVTCSGSPQGRCSWRACQTVRHGWHAYFAQWHKAISQLQTNLARKTTLHSNQQLSRCLVPLALSYIARAPRVLRIDWTTAARNCCEGGLLSGLDWAGLDWSGLDWTGVGWSGLDWETGVGREYNRKSLTFLSSSLCTSQELLAFPDLARTVDSLIPCLLAWEGQTEGQVFHRNRSRHVLRKRENSGCSPSKQPKNRPKSAGSPKQVPSKCSVSSECRLTSGATSENQESYKQELFMTYGPL